VLRCFFNRGSDNKWAQDNPKEAEQYLKSAKPAVLAAAGSGSGAASSSSSSSSSSSASKVGKTDADGKLNGEGVIVTAQGLGVKGI